MLREAAAALLLVALALAPALAAAPAPACVGTRPAQDDAGSGRDAPDSRALALPLRAEGYFWGWLDPLEGASADHADWYAVTLVGSGHGVMLSVSSNETGVYAGGPYRLEVFAPGADEPFATAVSYDEPIRFTDDAAGVYHVRVSPDAPVPVGPACPGPAAPDPLAAPTGEAVRNHGVYFGCDPVCDWLDDQAAVAA